MDLSTALFHDSEISKGSDFNNSAMSSLLALHPVFSELLSDVTNNVIISGMNITPAIPPSMNIVIGAGIAYSREEEKLLHLGNGITVPIANASLTHDRIDIIEVRLFVEETDEQSRSFKDPALGSISYDTVPVKKRISVEAQSVSGFPGSGVAPSNTDGWMKIAEVSIPYGTTQVISGNIQNITSVYDGMENTGWTFQKTETFRVGSMNTIRKQLVQHIENTITTTNAVHGIRQGHGQGFDSDTCDGSHYNPADVLAKFKTVDGHGSGSDSDLLDGQEGAFYQNAGNLNAGTIPLARLPTDLTGKKAQYAGRADSSASADTCSGNAATATRAASSATADYATVSGYTETATRAESAAAADYATSAGKSGSADKVFMKKFFDGSGFLVMMNNGFPGGGADIELVEGPVLAASDLVYVNHQLYGVVATGQLNYYSTSLPVADSTQHGRFLYVTDVYSQGLYYCARIGSVSYSWLKIS